MLISLRFKAWFITSYSKTTQKIGQNVITGFQLNFNRYNSEITKLKPHWNILFYGSDDFALTTLKMLHENRVQNKLIGELEVVNKSKNSLTSVKNYAMKNGIRTHTWPYEIPANKFHLGVVVSFGKLIPCDIINSFPYGMVNIHPSLIPKYRGPAPIIHTVLNGDTETGVTLLEVAPKKFDVGKMLVQEKIQVPPRVTSEELSNILAKMGARILEESLQDFDNIYRNAVPQSNEGVSLAPKPKKEMASIKWDCITSHEIDRLQRAIGSLYKLEAKWRGITVRLLDIIDPLIVETAKVDTLITLNEIKPGFVFYHKKRKCLFIKCKDGWCGVKNVFVIGRPKLMLANEFASGYLQKVPLEERYFDV